jgi:diadenylate cyclase
LGSSERLNDLLNRLGSYSMWEVAIEIALIWLVVYAVLRFVQGTRAARALKGLLFILIVGTLFVRFFGDDVFARIAYLYDRMLAVIAIALVVIFQPELRRALIRLGETRFMHGRHEGAAKIASEIAPACTFLSKARFGAIIVIERRVGLKSMIEGGTVLNADLSAPLIKTIFHPGSALHDLAVVIRGDQIHSAGVQLPMAGPSEIPDPSLGSRHRAAIGATKESDALVVVVSEETGFIRVAERGVLSAPIEPNELERTLRELLGHHADLTDSPADQPMSGFVDDQSDDQNKDTDEPSETQGSLMTSDAQSEPSEQGEGVQ